MQKEIFPSEENKIVEAFSFVQRRTHKGSTWKSLVLELDMSAQREMSTETVPTPELVL